MISMQGKGVSRGICKGKLYFYKRVGAGVTKQRVNNVEEEKKRLTHAMKKSMDQLNDLAAKTRAEAGDGVAVLFETYAMFIEDDDFLQTITDTIENEKCNAEYAVEQAGEQYAAMFENMDDAYMQARSADIRDVALRLINNLHGLKDVGPSQEALTDGALTEKGIAPKEPIILAADDLSPTETIQLDKSKILGFVTMRGTGNSHTAILARILSIPAICGLGQDLKPEYEGRMAYIDGETGQMVIDPDELTLSALRTKHEKYQEIRKLMETMKGQKDVTLDGREIMLYCNISSPDDVKRVLENDGHGIGLFRSEFLYLAASDYPTEEEQFEAYKKVAAAMDGKRVIIRTLDIGADKQVDYFKLNKEENPAMGIRAIRISLNNPEIFHTQLRALYRASAFGKVAIMFPMITSVWEVKECKAACRKAMAELKEEGIPFNPATELGIMIETPASVFMANELAQEVDFFSVGTNDLTQYTLACDRQSDNLGRFFDPHHPAVIRAIKMAVQAAHEAGIWIGICGEIAADKSLLPIFLEMDIDELSVRPSSVLPLRAMIRESSVKQTVPEQL